MSEYPQSETAMLLRIQQLEEALRLAERVADAALVLREVDKSRAFDTDGPLIEAYEEYRDALDAYSEAPEKEEFYYYGATNTPAGNKPNPDEPKPV